MTIKCSIPRPENPYLRTAYFSDGEQQVGSIQLKGLSVSQATFIKITQLIVEELEK